MAFSYHDYTGDNSTTQFSIPFTYQNTSEISVTVDGVAQTGLTFPSSSTVQLTSAPASGTLVQVRRTTDLTARAVDFASGSVLTEEDLDDSSIQTFHASQEAIDRANDAIALDTDDKWEAQSKVIKNVATPTNANDATNKAYVDTGANNAATSAAAALVSQNAAAASATAAANSATASAGSATTSANEATDSANSATASASSATASANSASAASTSESNAATSAATATTQAALATTNGAAQVSLATTQANNAAASASTASTQAANASSSASTAATQATNSATSATSSSNSATAAANSATAAATSETNAANSAAAAAAAFDNFDDTYLGSKTSDPAVDNDGDPLTQGDLYFNSTANEMRVYDGANWIAASSAGAASLILYEYTATSGQTTFSGTDDNAASLSYSVGNIQVVMNGVILDPSDFTATSGTSVVLASGAATGDLINIYAFKSFTVADTVSASAGGTFAANVNFDANANFGDNDKAQFGAGNDLQIYHDGSDSYVKDAGSGNLTLQGTNLNMYNTALSKIYLNATDGGSVDLYYDNAEKLATTSTGVDVTGVLNTTGDVGIGGSEKTVFNGVGGEMRLVVLGNDSTTTITNNSNSGIAVVNTNHTAGNLAGLHFARADTDYSPNYAGASIVAQFPEAQVTGQYPKGELAFLTSTATNSAPSEKMRIDNSGNVLVGKTSVDYTTVGFEATPSSAFQANAMTADGKKALLLARKTSDGEILQFRKDGTVVGSIGVRNGHPSFGNTDTGIELNDFSEAVQPFNTSTNSTRDAAIDLGSSSARFKDLYLSGGVYLGGTGSANHLDDYEEGTWSPAIDNLTYGSSNDYVMIGAGALTEVQSIPYTKIGRMVFIYGTIRFKATHNLRFAMSLPVTHSGSDYGMAGSVGGFGMPNGGSLGFLGGSGDRVDLFTISDTDGGHGNISVTAGDEIYFNFHYQAA